MSVAYSVSFTRSTRVVFLPQLIRDLRKGRALHATPLQIAMPVAVVYAISALGMWWCRAAPIARASEHGTPRPCLSGRGGLLSNAYRTVFSWVVFFLAWCSCRWAPLHAADVLGAAANHVRGGRMRRPSAW